MQVGAIDCGAGVHPPPRASMRNSPEERGRPRRKHPRLELPVYQQGHLVFVTIGTSDRYAWFQRYPALCKQAAILLGELSKNRGGLLYAWCLMPDHVHILVQDDDLIGMVRIFKGRMTPKSRLLEPSRKLWQKSFHDHILRKEESVLNVADYIWQNPVRAGLVDHPSQYIWSGSEEWPHWKEMHD